MAHTPLEDSLKFASIDIGSNAMRLLFSRVVQNSSVTFVKESLIRMPLRLGEDAFTDGYISDYNIKRLKNTVHAFHLMIKAYEPISFKACATAALRTASNGRDIVNQINDQYDVGLEIISGKEEARIIMSNHIERHLNPNKHYVYIDVGGGSTEISFIMNNEKTSSKSFPIGSVRILKNQVISNDWNEMQQWITQKKSQIDGPIQSIGTGGNINKIFSMSDTKKNNEIDVNTIKQVLDQLKPLDVKHRIIELGLRPDRADVITHAGKIYLSAMEWSECSSMIVPHSGLPDGIIHELYEDYIS